jgi:hypothetical protein
MESEYLSKSRTLSQIVLKLFIRQLRWLVAIKVYIQLKQVMGKLESGRLVA